MFWVVALFIFFTPNVTGAGEINRYLDPVVVSGAEFSSLLGVDTASLHLYAVDSKGELSQIPFQIDERFAGGELVLTPNRLEGTGTLSSRDEVVFMARDLGVRLRPGANSLTVQMMKEIEVKDPESGRKAYAYLVWNAVPPLHLPLQYVQFNAAERSVMGESYFLNFDAKPAGPESLFWQENHLAMAWNQSQGGEVFFTPNVFKRGFLRVDLTSRGSLLHMQMNAKDMNATEIGQISGSVRTARKFRLHPKLGYGLKAKPVTLVQYFYDQFMSTELYGDVQNVLAPLFSEIRVVLGEEFADAYAPQIRYPNFGDHNLIEVAVEEGDRYARSYWRVVANDRILSAIRFAIDESKDAPCVRCLILELDGKKLATQPLQFSVERFFPGVNGGADLAAFLRLRDRPVEVRVSDVSQSLVLQLPNRR